MVARVAAGGRGCHDGGGLSAGDGGRGSGIDGEGWLHDPLRLQRRRCRDGWMVWQLDGMAVSL